MINFQLSCQYTKNYIENLFQTTDGMYWKLYCREGQETNPSPLQESEIHKGEPTPKFTFYLAAGIWGFEAIRLGDRSLPLFPYQSCTYLFNPR